MRIPFVLACLTVVAFAAAQEGEQPLTLEQAYALVPAVDADLVSARTAVQSAARDLERTRADPLALRLDLLQDEQALAAAHSGLASAQLATRIDVATAYTAALEADTAVALAEADLAIAEVTLEAQRIRLGAGAVTQLDVDRAVNGEQVALADLADSTAARDLAYARLGSLLGQTPGLLAPLDRALLVLPDVVEAQARALQENAQLLANQRSVELAEVRLAGLDNAFTARSEIETAQEALDSARLRLGESRRTLELNIQNSYNAALSAQARVESARANLETARAELNAQRTRLDAGTISPLSYAQAELSFHNTEASVDSAEHGFYLGLLRLEQTVIGQ